ncbi:NifB/NifX family molybdenum-iron cluster-binding protein [Ellagibacter isourolithinifaciens]|uniref:NifB/NifX family molybdenum-iron cluster-binding protein n=1 Tax=Ellagibacter isourolithinifaciens TaxID=2137581 RepID=UPI003AF1B4D6
MIDDCSNLPNPGLSAEDTAQMFIDLGVSTIITGGIDYDFANMLCHAGIEVVAGVEGSAREVLEAYINHTLIGADELCHTLAFNNDEEEAEVDDTFAKLEANFFTANA